MRFIRIQIKVKIAIITKQNNNDEEEAAAIYGKTE